MTTKKRQRNDKETTKKHCKGGLKIVFPMKFATIVLFAVLVLAGCKKEDYFTLNSGTEGCIYKVKNVSVCHKVQKNISDISNYAWINFASVDSYTEAIDSLNSWGDSCFALFEENLNFYSMRRYLSEDVRETLGLDDDLLATILNPDGVVQIGDYIFKLDFTSEQVEVFNILSGSSEGFYNFDENVLDILYGYEQSEHNVIVNEQRSDVLKRTVTYSGTCDVKCKIVYQRAAIYFSLLVKTHKLCAISVPAVEIGYDTYDGSYRKNRTNAGLQYITDQYDGGTKSGYTYRPYSAMCGLQYIRWTSEFNILDMGHSTSRTYILSIRKG